MAASDDPVKKNLPNSVAAYTFFMRKVFLVRIFPRALLVSVLFPLVPDVSTFCGLCDGLCFSLSSTSFSSVNIKTYNVHQTRKSLNQIRARSNNYSSRETTAVLFPPHKRRNKRTSSDDQWHKSQWQQNRWRTDQKGTNVVKFCSPQGTILENFSFEHNYYHHQTRPPTTPGSDLDWGQPQGHHAGSPSQRYQAYCNNYMTPPQLSISLHASRHIFISGNSRHRFGITCKHRKWSTDMTKNRQCRIESN